MEATAFFTEGEAIGRKEVWKEERKMKTEQLRKKRNMAECMFA